MKILRGISETTFSNLLSRYTIIIITCICISVLIEFLYNAIVSWIDPGAPNFLSEIDIKFVENFIEWFGVLYGFLLPLILVRVWEQFDEIENVFDREADTIKILFEDILLLHSDHKSFKTSVLRLLFKYVNHVLSHYDKEGKDTKGEIVRDQGNQILKEIREKYIALLHGEGKKTHESDALVSELLDSLNDIIDLRGDRISLSTQRLFESLKFVAVATSVVWLIPFYFLFQNGIGAFSTFLMICVIFLVVVILSIIEDLDEPFGGQWRIKSNSWEKLRDDLRVYK